VESLELLNPLVGPDHKTLSTHDLDLGRCFMVGDKADDVEAGKRAGCRTLLVRTGCGRESESRLETAGPRPDGVVDDLAAAALAIAAFAAPGTQAE
jgi:D-glycero-D-manno-heptose 1,7-bisphosphate phosphatase